MALRLKGVLVKTLMGLIVALLLALTGCSSTEDTPAPQTKDEQYLALLDEHLVGFDVTDETQMISAGQKTCDYFRDHGVNLTSVAVLTDALSSSFSNEQSATLVLAATKVYCPDIADALLELAGGGSV